MTIIPMPIVGVGKIVYRPQMHRLWRAPIACMLIAMPMFPALLSCDGIDEAEEPVLCRISEDGIGQHTNSSRVSAELYPCDEEPPDDLEWGPWVTTGVIDGRSFACREPHGCSWDDSGKPVPGWEDWSGYED